jgi:Nuclease-related domain
MASPTPRRFPLDDDDRPSGSVQPLSQADLQAILATGATRSLTSCWPAPTPIGRWWRCGSGPAWAARAARLTRPGGGCGRPSGRPGPGACPGGSPFRPSPDAVAWQPGAAGERRTAQLLDPLERHGWAVLHDLAVPGSQANIDHLVIGPGGVVVIDSQQYRGRLQLDPCGRLCHGRSPLAPTLRAVDFEADQAAVVLPDPGLAVVPVVAVHGAQVPGQGRHRRAAGGGGPAPAQHASRPPAGAQAQRVADLADHAHIRFHAAG